MYSMPFHLSHSEIATLTTRGLGLPQGLGLPCSDYCVPLYMPKGLLRLVSVTFADSYLGANIEFRNKACTRGKYYSCTKLYFVLFVFIYVYSHMFVRHVLAVALASLP